VDLFEVSAADWQSQPRGRKFFVPESVKHYGNSMNFRSVYERYSAAKITLQDYRYGGDCD